MKRVGRIGRLIIWIFFLAVLWKPITVNAGNGSDEDGEERSHPDGIVKIITAYTDDEGNIYYTKQGTGFVVGVGKGTSDSSNKKYIVSDYGIVEGEAVYLDTIKRKYGLGSDTKLTLNYYAIGDMGVLSDLKIVSYSSETRYVVLEPSGVLADKDYLKLGDGSKVEKEARIHIEGYSGMRSIITDTSIEERSIKVYDTVITDVFTENYYNDVITYFHVGEAIDEGMAGAPILDTDDCVIGMFILNNGTIRAMSVENLRVILDALAINYMVAEDDATYDVPTAAQRSTLKDLIVDNKDYISTIKKRRYTETSWNTLYNAISEADKVYLNVNSTAKQFDDSIATLKNARKKLREKTFKWKIINVIAGVVGVVLFIILTKILKKRKKIKKEQDKISNMSVSG